MKIIVWLTCFVALVCLFHIAALEKRIAQLETRIETPAPQTQPFNVPAAAARPVVRQKPEPRIWFTENEAKERQLDEILDPGSTRPKPALPRAVSQRDE
jgi:hypothetical protein